MLYRTFFNVQSNINVIYFCHKSEKLTEHEKNIIKLYINF